MRNLILTIGFFSALQILSIGIQPAARAQSLVDTTENVTHTSGDAEWIWTGSQKRNEAPIGDCFFRRSFRLGKPEHGEVQISADNRFELFVNGQPVGQGNDWRKIQVFDITQHLQSGNNTVAVRATNTDVGAAGLVARVLVKEKGGPMVSYSTDRSWKASVRHYQNWQSPQFPEREWVAAESYGLLGGTLPWGDEVVFAGEGTRFEIGQDFVIERLLRDEEVGSLIAMTFDSAGNILASREGGPLLLLSDADGSGAHETVDVFCDKLRNVQGILSLGTRVFAVGDGPQGVALYRLRDENRDGVAEEIKMLVPMAGSKGEHGAHAVRLGPDGLLYVILGNHARVGRKPSPRSPYHHWVEGDLVQPRHEDPQGHAVGIPAPGGTIVRTDTEGSFVELFAGGLRNSYDFAFSRDGELLTYDADMEWDRGAPWYRPTRINHVTAGAELGWRSGWAKWPSYYLDSLPAALNIGPGSPTGVEVYDHTAFPEQYRGAMFGCDWATGRIYAIRFEREGATLRGSRETFVEGRPLNATDLAVGPDGAIYFCTGGRGTDGGVYRIRWTGKKPSDHLELGGGIDRALRQPQLDGDWARSEIARVKAEMADRWPTALETAARDAQRSTAERQRALELMELFGPRPSEQLLVDLTSDDNPALRAKAASLLYIINTPAAGQRLTALLEDLDPWVRRVACESLVRQGTPAPLPALFKLLDDDDRFVAFAARRALEQIPAEQWASLVSTVGSTQAFCHASVALLAMSPSQSACHAVLKRCEQELVNFKSTDDLVNMLRVVQLALSQPASASYDRTQLTNVLSIFPYGDWRADREAVRLLTYLQPPYAAELLAGHCGNESRMVEKLHVAAYASRLKSGWTLDRKSTFAGFFEHARTLRTGYSVDAYLERFAREFFANYTPEERLEHLSVGEQIPTSTLSLLASLPKEIDAETLASLRALDGRVRPKCAESDVHRRLRVGILAVLARSGEAESLAYLRTIYRDAPAQRNTVAMALTQHPDGENWAILIDSLKTVEGRAAQEVLVALTKVAERPREPEAFRQVILHGLRFGNTEARHALRLLDHWSGRQPSTSTTNWQTELTGWQQWYAKHFPDAPPAELPRDSGSDKWSYDELLTYLESEGARSGNATRGAEAFAAASCAKCHRCGSQGASLGPDLTSVARRFQRKEILQSIVYPSHVISDQYAARTVVANGRSYTGLVLPRGNQGVDVVLTDGEKVELNHEAIDQIVPSATSAMPTGLLNSLTLEQVADLFAYLDNAGQAEVAQKRSETTR